MSTKRYFYERDALYIFERGKGQAYFFDFDMYGFLHWKIKEMSELEAVEITDRIAIEIIEKLLRPRKKHEQQSI